MIHTTEYERAKKIVDQYVAEHKPNQSVICTLNNLELRRGEDGHWLAFSTLDGWHGVLNIENCFPADERITNNAIRQWAKEQEELWT